MREVSSLRIYSLRFAARSMIYSLLVCLCCQKDGSIFNVSPWSLFRGENFRVRKFRTHTRSMVRTYCRNDARCTMKIKQFSRIKFSLDTSGYGFPLAPPKKLLPDTTQSLMNHIGAFSRRRQSFHTQFNHND